MADTGAKTKQVNWKLVKSILAGSKRYLLLGAFSVIIAAIASYAMPLVVSFTVDYVLEGKQVLAIPEFIYALLDKLGGREYLRSHIYLCAAALIILAAINGLFSFIRGLSVSVASELLAKNMRDSLYTQIQNKPYDYHKHVSTGDLVQRCTSDVDTVRRFISVQFMEVVRTIAMLSVAMSIMFSVHAGMALISSAVLPVLCLCSFLYFKKVRRQFLLSDEAEGRLSAVLQENLSGMRVVRAMGQQQSEVEKFTRCNTEYKDITNELIRLLGIYWGISDCMGYMQIALTLTAGVYLAVTTDFTLGQLLVFTTYSGMMTWPVRQMGRILADMGKAVVSLGRLDEVLAAPEETEPGKALKPEIKGYIKFENVCFGYDAYDDVLKDISFTARPGETVAILGASGSGKTSLVQLIQRLYTCTAGRITIDGVDINDIDRFHLRRHIGIVLQEPFLYSRNIMENIRITNPDAPPEQVYEASRVAALHDVVMKFERGYDTLVGERGVTLSGGQKQRTAIARTLMQKAPILIFDDSLSAVDTETDAAIRKALSRAAKHSTTFIISHRITTLCEADKILVLENGRLVQQGTHEQLMEQDGLYRRIALIQNLEDEDTPEEGGER